MSYSNFLFHANCGITVAYIWEARLVSCKGVNNMNLKIKDIIAIAVVTVLSFPIMYLTMLFVTGSARIEFGVKQEEPKEKIEKIEFNKRKDSLSIANSKTFMALQMEKTELQKERERLVEKEKKIDLLQTELEEKRKAFEQERAKIEKLVSLSDSLDRRKIKELSNIYGAMRPAEAAQIIETLQDDLASKVIASIGDERQKGKILSALSKDKASRISKLLGPKLNK